MTKKINFILSSRQYSGRYTQKSIYCTFYKFYVKITPFSDSHLVLGEVISMDDDSDLNKSLWCYFLCVDFPNNSKNGFFRPFLLYAQSHSDQDSTNKKIS